MWSTGVFILLVCQLAGHVAAGSNLQSRETVKLNGNAEDGPMMVCYYTPTRYFPADKVPSNACTHLIYAFGSLSGASLDITTPTSGVKAIWQTLTSLRRQSPQLKVMLSLQQGFPSVVGADAQRMQKFAVNSVAFLREYGFDGVDMDWEYPSGSQKDDFAKFFTLMRAAIDADAKKTGKAALLLSLALPNNQYVVARSFDIPTIARAVDFATAMTYDFHVYSKGDSRTGYNSPLYAPTGESRYLSASGMATYYLQAGFPGPKLLLGIPTYGRSWKLASAGSHGLHALALGKGDPGPYRNITGVYTYPDACVAIKQGAQKVPDPKAGAAYLYHSTTWVAYDNAETVGAKCRWARSNGLGGVGVWAMHLDDISGVCGQGPLPLLKTMKTFLLEQTPVHPLHLTITNDDDDLKEARPKPNLQPSPIRMPADAGTKETESIVYREVHQDLYAVILRSEQSSAAEAASSRFQLRPRGPGLTLERSGSKDEVIFMENVDVLLEESSA